MLSKSPGTDYFPETVLTYCILQSDFLECCWCSVGLGFCGNLCRDFLGFFFQDFNNTVIFICNGIHTEINIKNLLYELPEKTHIVVSKASFEPLTDADYTF